MKNIFLILTIILLANITVFSQDEMRKKHFLIGGFASLGISSYAANINVNNFYVPGFSYNLGLEAFFQIKPKFSMSIGLQYDFKNSKTKNLSTSYGTPSPLEPTFVKFNYNGHYLDIPIRVDFYLSKRKIVPIITTGISTNLFIKEKVSYTNTYIDGHKEEGYYYTNKTFYPIHLEYQLGMGIDIALSKSRLRVFPLYKRSGYFNSFQLGIQYLFGV